MNKYTLCFFILSMVGSRADGNIPERPDPHGSNVVVYPAPKELAPSPLYTLEVEGKQVFCYPTTACYRHYWDDQENTFGFETGPIAFAIFDFTGKVNVLVHLSPDLLVRPEKLCIYPLSRNISYTLEGNSLSFELDEYIDLTIDPNGDKRKVLHLFVNEPEKDIPDKNDPSVIYYGPGVHDIESLKLESGQTLYLAGGAVLQPSPRIRSNRKTAVYPAARPGKPMYYYADPSVSGDGIENVTIRGRGILSGLPKLEEKKRSNLLYLSNSAHIDVRDVVLVDNTAWNMHFRKCRDVTVDRVRIIGSFPNTDGFCFNGCVNSRARKCFAHIYDDCFEVKVFDKDVTSHDILFEDCICWTGCGSPMGITHEIAGTAENLIWKNITVIQYDGVIMEDAYSGIRAAIFLHAAHGGIVKNIRFEDILIESSHSKLLTINNEPANEFGYAKISNILFKNVVANQVADPRLSILDDSGEGRINNIQFDHVVLNGDQLTDEDDRIFILGAQNISAK